MHTGVEQSSLRSTRRASMQVNHARCSSTVVPSTRDPQGSRFCGKNSVSVGTSRSRPPAKLQYEPRIHTVHQGNDICTRVTKYGTLVRLVHPRKLGGRSPHKTSNPVWSTDVRACQGCSRVNGVPEHVSALTEILVQSGWHRRRRWNGTDSQY